MRKSAPEYVILLGLFLHRMQHQATLASYLTGLRAEGRIAFTRDEVFTRDEAVAKLQITGTPSSRRRGRRSVTRASIRHRFYSSSVGVRR
jgi:hypothetical protein